MSDALPTADGRANDGHEDAGAHERVEERVARLERQAARERKARREAEAVAERSLRHLYGQREQLQLLRALSAAANAAGDVEEAMGEALRLVYEHTGWPVGHVYRRRGDRLVSAALWCLGDAERFAGWRAATEATAFEAGEGLPGRVLATGRPAWVYDVAVDPDFPRASAAAAHGLRGAMAFPIRLGDEVAAVMEFFSERPEEPDEALLEVMAYAGAQLGHVVERQRLERRHALILGAAGEGIYGLDAEGRTTFINPAAAALVGWAPEALVGVRLHEQLHHHHADGAPYAWEESPVHAVLRDGRERRVSREVFWRRDGTAFPVEYVATPLWEGDEVAGVVVAFHDVSEREELVALRETQALLAREEARYRFLADLNGALLPLTEPDAITAAANRLLGEHLGVDRCAYADVEPDEDHFTITVDYTRGAAASIVGRYRMADFGAEALRLMRQGRRYVVHDVEADGRVSAADLAVYRATGIRAVVCVPLHRGGRFVAGMAVHQAAPRRWTDDEVALVEAVTRRCWESVERARAVKALRHSEQQLLALVDNLPELAWWSRPDGHIDFYNRRWYTYTGTTFEEMEGWGWEKVHDPEMLPAVVERWRHALETGEPFEMEFPLRGADGAFRWFLTRAHPLRDAEGEITRWIGINADIDEHSRTAAALEEARRDLAEVNRTLEERVRERTAELATALQALGDSEALLNSVTANALDGIAALEAVRDDEGRIVDFRWLLVNPEAEAIYGRSRAELDGALQSEVLPAVKEAGLHDALVRVVETGAPFRQEVQALEDPARWFSLSVSKLGDGVVALFRDVSEGKAAEAALRASEAQLRQAQHLAHVGSWRWDIGADRVTWSEELHRIFGYEPGAVEVDYGRYDACLHPDDREGTRRVIQAAVADKEGYEVNHRIVRPDGTVRWIHSFGEVITDGAGAAVALQGTAQDVTERVEHQQALQRYAAEVERAEAEVRANAGFLQSSLDALAAHVAILDEGGQILAVNEAWRRFARENGYQGTTYGLGESYLDACADGSSKLPPHGDVAADVGEGIRALLRGETERFTTEYSCHSPDENRWFLLNITRFEGPEGLRLVTAHEDVTEMKRAEAALQRYAAELEESNEELQKFAYVASHDLQEPLRMVTSFLQLLERRYDAQLDEAGREYIGYAVDGARRMQRLIQDLLAYSRVSRRTKGLTPVDAREVALDVLHDLGPAVEEAGAAVDVNGLPVVLADPTQLHQLLLNLIGNALKFRRPAVAPRIRVAAEPARLGDGRPAWRFAVSDNGIGLDPQYAERVFQVFQRLHTREEYEGTGIGLAICKKIVERHGGVIGVESAPGRGATFHFTLPAPSAVPADARAAGSADPTV